MAQNWDRVIPKVGETPTDPNVPYYELIISDHIRTIDPISYGIELRKIDPNYYFITSGDAVEKVKYLKLEFKRLLDDTKTVSYNRKTGAKCFKNLVADIKSAIKETDNLLKKLLIIRGTHIFLETEHIASAVCLLPKDPRIRG